METEISEFGEEFESRINYQSKKGKNMDLEKAVIKIGKTEQGKETKQYYLMPVQYNPSSLSFSSRAGWREEQGPGAVGMRARQSMILPPETVLSVELFFEAAEEPEHIDFVQQRTEGLLSLVMQTCSRQVVFAWGEMSFGGELEEVRTEYTMFDNTGSPIMARFSLSIRRAGADSPDGINQSENNYWTKAWRTFQKLAEEKNGVL